MRALIWLIRLFLFLVLFGFALKNDEVVVLNFFFGGQWQAPLVLVILLFVVIGVLIGLSATFATVYRQRREISQLRGKVGASGMPEVRSGAPVVSGPDLPESY
ncbi:MAG: LapA family protein [Proteobacteria bacterium]|nr:LapA family protein [Pseudomonadota bacterium]